MGREDWAGGLEGVNGQKEGGGTGRWERRIRRARGSEWTERGRWDRKVGKEDRTG